MGKKNDLNRAIEAESATQHMALAEELNKLAELHMELAELHEEQENLMHYKEFCEMKNELRDLSNVYEEAGDTLRMDAIRRSIPLPAEFLDYMKRRHDKQYFEEVILGKSNIFEALLVYGPQWLQYDENARLRPAEEIFAE